MVLIVMIWHEHFVFYYRYGFRNTKVVILNTLFLIIVMFYVYPLKFLCKLLCCIHLALPSIRRIFSLNYRRWPKASDTAQLMTIYGIGAASIFFSLDANVSLCVKKFGFAST
jgi:hypothetical protein